MALGTLWFARIPSTSQAWELRLDTPASFIPPLSYFLDIFPGGLVYGLGATILVAPLTTAVMTSVPVGNSGLASAINNSISRVGPQLAGALIFVAITASFYHALGVYAPQLDTSSQQTRVVISPLNRPAASVPPDQAQAARRASTDAFHLAMLVYAGLMSVGAGVNGVGIRNPESQAGAQRSQMPAGRPAG